MKNVFGNLKFVSGLIMAIALFAGFWAVDASAQTIYTYNNNGASIQILDRDKTNPNPQPANPYPSTISVSGAPTSATRVIVKIKGFTHSFPDDVGVLLVAPGGRKVRLFTDCMGDGDGDGITTPIDLTFDDFAAEPLPDNPSNDTPSGTYKPREGTPFGDTPQHPANFPMPAPSGSYENTLATLNGVNPNGDWKLYVDDDGPQDDGEITNGWELSFQQSVPTSAPAVISGNVHIPGGGVVNARVTMVNSNGLETIVYTDMSGYYQFLDIPTGQTYVLSVSAKGRTFTPSTQTVTLTEDTTINWSGN